MKVLSESYRSDTDIDSAQSHSSGGIRLSREFEFSRFSQLENSLAAGASVEVKAFWRVKPFNGG